MIDQKARAEEIADVVCNNWEIKHRGQEFSMSAEAARLGIIEGLEMAAQVADALGTNIWQAQSFGFLKDELLDKETTTEIAKAIRARIEESRG